MEDKQGKTLNETIKELRSTNEETIQLEEAKRTKFFKENFQNLLNNIEGSKSADIQTSAIGISIENNIQSLIEPIMDAGSVSRDDAKNFNKTLARLAESIKLSNDVNGDEQDRLLSIISDTQKTIIQNSTRDFKMLEGFSEKVVDTSINTATGLAALASGGNPLVMLLTKTLLQGTKDGALRIKEWNKQRKERKKLAKEEEIRVLKSIEVQEEVKDTLELENKDVLNENEIAALWTDSLEKFNENTKSNLDVESLIDPLTENIAALNETISKQLDSKDSSVVESKSNETSTVELVKQLLEVEAERNEIELLKNAENLEAKAEEKEFQVKLLGALEKDNEVEISDPKNPFLKILLAAGAFLVGAVMGFVTEIKNALRIVKGIFTGWFDSIKNSKLGKFIAKIFDDIKKGPIGNFFSKIKTFFTENKFFKTIGKTIDKVKKSLKPVTNFFTKIKDFFVKTFSKLGNVLKFGDDAGGFVAKFLKFGKSFGKILGKIAFPITVAMAVFDTVMGFIDGFKEDGIMGGIQGALTGLFDSLIGGLLDLVKDGVSWLLDLMGFENASGMLDSFSFSELFGKLIDSMFSSIENMIDYVKDIFSFDNLSKFIPESILSFVGIESQEEKDKKIATQKKLGQEKSELDILKESKSFFRNDSDIEELMEMQTKIDKTKELLSGTTDINEQKILNTELRTQLKEFKEYFNENNMTEVLGEVNYSILEDKLEDTAKFSSDIIKKIKTNSAISESVSEVNIENLRKTVAMNDNYKEGKNMEVENQTNALQNAGNKIATSVVNSVQNINNNSNMGIVSAPVAGMAMLPGE